MADAPPPTNQPNLGDHLVTPLLRGDIAPRDALMLWLVALVFTTTVTAILLLIGRWQ